MMGHFPVPYPDELLYSVFARYYAHSGYMAYAFAAQDLFVKKATKPDIEFINELTPDALERITQHIPLESVIEKHTMFPYYARFLPKVRRQQAFSFLFQMDERYHNHLYLPKSKHIARFLRYCPLCAKEDRAQYGEAYWHRIHQMTGINICPKHHCQLQNSPVPISSKDSPSLITVEECVLPLDNVIFSDNELEINVAEYVCSVFNSPVDMDTDISVGQFFHSKMEYTKFLSSRGEQRNTALIHSDFSAHYVSLPDHPLKEQWQIQKMLSSDRLSTYEVCLFAMFLGIPPADLVKMTRPEISQSQWFDEKIRTLHSQGLKYPEIARQMNASYDVVKAIGEGRY